MNKTLVTIGGQPVYRKDDAPDIDHKTAYRDARDAEDNLRATTAMSPNGWAGGSDEGTLEAGLPFLGVFVAIILFTIALVVLFKRGR